MKIFKLAHKLVSIDDLSPDVRYDIACILQGNVPLLHNMSPEAILDELVNLVDSPMLEIREMDPKALRKQFGSRSTSNIAVLKYKAILDKGIEMDPVLVARDKFIDGGHRVEAYIMAGRETIPVVDIDRLLGLDWDRWLAGDSTWEELSSEAHGN